MEHAINPLLAGYLGVIVLFGVGVWAGHDMGPPPGAVNWHWLSLFITRNHPFVIVDWGLNSGESRGLMRRSAALFKGCENKNHYRNSTGNVC